MDRKRDRERCECERSEPASKPVGLASRIAAHASVDNVTLALSSPVVKNFRIEAAHPAYIGALQRDSFEADWTACDLKSDPAFKSDVGVTMRKTLYEEPALWVVGWTFPTYWRPATATVRIGDRVEKGLHMLQIWMIRPMGGEEVLILYPQDGYWRIRPKAPQGMAPTAFGSSFLIGPVEDDGRPIVKIREVAFDPKARAFTLTFERGGSVTVKLARLAQLGPYRFDLALGESQRLDLGRWVDAAAMRRTIDALPHSANSGDVYAVLHG